MKILDNEWRQPKPCTGVIEIDSEARWQEALDELGRVVPMQKGNMAPILKHDRVFHFARCKRAQGFHRYLMTPKLWIACSRNRSEDRARAARSVHPGKFTGPKMAIPGGRIASDFPHGNAN